jgi:RNA ligase (TIGR02306 family)
MKLATIELIRDVRKHPNADSLDIVKVLGYECVVKLGQYRAGDKIVFIQPDSVLPDKPWAAFYKAKSNRVKAIKLRQAWSEGVVESLSNTGLGDGLGEGADVTDALGVVKYEAPQPQDLSAKGGLPFGIGMTDEERINNLGDDEIPWGQKVDVTLKIDGQSASYLYKLGENGEEGQFCIIGRTLEYKEDAENNYSRNAAAYDIKNKLSQFCMDNKVSLAVRGESHGGGIQKNSNNYHSRLPLRIAFFSTWLVDEGRHARKGHPFYIFDLAGKLGIPTVPLLEKDVVLTPGLVRKYMEELSEVNGHPFEGVVIQHERGSFKVLCKDYDSKK